MKALVILVNAVTLAAVLVILALPARAAPVCGDRTKMLAVAEHKYGEKAVASGLSSNRAYIEFLVSSDGKTWTLLATGPSGKSCVAAIGTAGEVHTPKYGEKN